MLLLDEPLSALDYKLRKEMQIELKRLQLETGITFIFVTHDQEEALTMSDRIAVMNKGQILQIGSPHDIYDRPAERFVADFIGETNFLEGKLQSFAKGKATVKLCIRGHVLEADVPDGFAPTGKVTVVVRPEHADLATSGKPRFSMACWRTSSILELIRTIMCSLRMAVRSLSGSRAAALAARALRWAPWSALCLNAMPRIC